MSTKRKPSSKSAFSKLGSCCCQRYRRSLKNAASSGMKSFQYSSSALNSNLLRNYRFWSTNWQVILSSWFVKILFQFGLCNGERIIHATKRYLQSRFSQTERFGESYSSIKRPVHQRPSAEAIKHYSSDKLIALHRWIVYSGKKLYVWFNNKSLRDTTS